MDDLASAIVKWSTRNALIDNLIRLHALDVVTYERATHREMSSGVMAPEQFQLQLQQFQKVLWDREAVHLDCTRIARIVTFEANRILFMFQVEGRSAKEACQLYRPIPIPQYINSPPDQPLHPQYKYWELELGDQWLLSDAVKGRTTMIHPDRLTTCQRRGHCLRCDSSFTFQADGRGTHCSQRLFSKQPEGLAKTCPFTIETAKCM